MQKSILALLFAVVFISAFAQCPTGDVVLSTQGQVNQFINDYPNCTTINGDLTIEGTVGDISGLTNLVHVQGDLKIEDSSLNTINLNSLTTVDGGLRVTQNSQLTSVQFNNVSIADGGIDISLNVNLITIAGMDLVEEVLYLQISNNYNLVTIPSFTNLVTVYSSISFSENESLVAFSGFDNLVCASSFTIHGNDSLTDPPLFPSLRFVDNTFGFRISYNTSLKHYAGFEALERVSFFIIDGNGGGGTTSTMPSFNALREVGSLNISSCGIAELNGFNNLVKATEVNLDNLAATHITGFHKLKNVFNIDIADNFFLTEINGFNELKVINNLRLFNNNSLFITNCFTQIREIRRDLKIGSNHQITNLDFLSNLIFVGEFVNSNEITISVNGNLTDCSGISNLLNFGHLPNDVDIALNPFPCGSITEIQNNGDNDNDGILDTIDLDDDNDGILDVDEQMGTAPIDTDADLLPDHLDLDSDNDGCFDAVEAGFTDGDANGSLGTLPDTVDANGLILGEASGYTTPQDQDGNGTSDFQDMTQSPIISNHPQNLVVNSGDTFDLTTTIINADTFQWYVSIDGGQTWSILNNDAVYSNTNSQALTISNITLGFDSYLYRVGYSNSLSTCSQIAYSDAALINVFLNAPNPGTNANIAVCNTDGQVDLFSLLGGSPDSGGTWSPALQSGTSIFDPSVDNSGNYTYVVTDGACFRDTAIVTIIVNDVPNSGTDTTLNICENSNPFDLFFAIPGSPDAGGTFSPMLSNGSMFDPMVDVAGDYTYTVTNTCGSSSTVITIDVNNDVPFAGNDSTVELCENDASIDLFQSITGNPDTGGIWSPTLASGTNMFDPAIDVAGIYTYTIDNGNCGTDSAELNVTINNLPNAGAYGTLDICDTSAPVDLFDSLNGTPESGGVWSPALISGTGVFDPAADNPGIYTYTVTNGLCGSQSAEVKVSVEDLPNAGQNGSITLCESDNTINLYHHLNDMPVAGGVWSPSLASGTGVFDPSVDSEGIYTYTVTNAICGSNSAEVNVMVEAVPNTGSDGSLEICINSGVVDLFDYLNGSPDVDGVWSPALASGTSIFNPASDGSGTYTYSVTNGICGYATAEVEVIVFTEIPITNYEINITELTDNNSIEIVIDSNLYYQYSLDGINYQDSNVFYNLIGGDYTIYVREVNGCGILEETVSLIDYPRFFTPNYDGAHDFWGIRGRTDRRYKIYIYDRFGKLLTQLSPSNVMWDGTYNGNPLPTSDYWFEMIFEDGATKTGHFTLKR
jgi:gliding motility-associated-like protein